MTRSSSQSPNEESDANTFGSTHPASETWSETFRETTEAALKTQKELLNKWSREWTKTETVADEAIETVHDAKDFAILTQFVNDKDLVDHFLKFSHWIAPKLQDVSLAIEAATNAIESDNPLVRLGVAVVLHRVDPRNEAARACLDRLANDEHPIIRRVAFHALLYLDSTLKTVYIHYTNEESDLLCAIERYLRVSGRPTESLPPPSTHPKPADDWRRQFDTLMAARPAEEVYEPQAQWLERVKHDVNHQIMDQAASAIKGKLQTWEHNTYAKKLEITRWLNAELRRFDLTISSPEVGGPATLSADAAGRGGEGRFQLKGKTKGENGRHAYFSTQSLPELLGKIEFVNSLRREALTEWRERVSDQNPGETSRA